MKPCVPRLKSLYLTHLTLLRRRSAEATAAAYDADFSASHFAYASVSESSGHLFSLLNI